MSTDDKIENTGEKAKGAIKEGVGKLTGNKRLENEGRTDQAKSDAKQAGEHLKDAFKH
ncbi:CsbD family protein [Streptomyces sp. BE20]|uniref:CsbD family protein n=1 Tax=Streptomyces sp. BE20 TaxID=3002525 RepID=UPI002E791E6E|nr:CsbD family protein [Streptomyces sp. BE20]MEE1821096.1 CsbD family protein [Streptomyces sp. BE20]